MAPAPLTWFAARTHPRHGGLVGQLLVLLVATVLGLLLGLALLTADRSSWSGARTTTATVLGVTHEGVQASADGRNVSLHVTPVPPRGARLQVQVSPDGRARPVGFRQTAGRASKQGVGLVLLLAVLVQAYRLVVTRRPAE